MVLARFVGGGPHITHMYTLFFFFPTVFLHPVCCLHANTLQTRASGTASSPPICPLRPLLLFFLAHFSLSLSLSLSLSRSVSSVCCHGMHQWELLAGDRVGVQRIVENEFCDWGKKILNISGQNQSFLGAPSDSTPSFSGSIKRISRRLPCCHLVMEKPN